MTNDAVPIEEAHAMVGAEHVQKAVGKALEEFTDKLIKYQEKTGSTAPEPKSWFIDPNDMLDSTGLGYRVQPNMLTYETIRAFAERNSCIGSIIQLRTTQTEPFTDVQHSKYGTGFKVVPVYDSERALTRSEHERQHYLEQYILWCGKDRNVERDEFRTFVHKLVRDRLVFDQAAFEKVRSLDNRMHSFYAVDGSTIRIAAPIKGKATPQSTKETIKYVQMVDGEIAETYTMDELAFMVANPRTNIRVGGYGFSEIEMLITTVTSHLWAEQWNRNAFKQGSTMRGVMNLPGVNQTTLDMFRRQWGVMMSGVENAHKLPVINAPGAQWLPMNLSNTEMGYQLWLEYLIKVICAFYLVDPAEINHDLRGGVGSAPAFMTTNEAQQKLSKDRGLPPLLRHISNGLNRNILSQVDPRWKVVFVGLDAKTEAENVELRTKQSSSILTLNEARSLEKLPPVPHGDIINNPTYTGYLRDQAMAAQQQQQPPGGMPQDAAGASAGAFGTKPPSGADVDARKTLEKKAETQSTDEPKKDAKLKYFEEDDWQSTNKSMRGERSSILKSLYPDGYTISVEE